MSSNSIWTVVVFLAFVLGCFTPMVYHYEPAGDPKGKVAEVFTNVEEVPLTRWEKQMAHSDSIRVSIDAGNVMVTKTFHMQGKDNATTEWIVEGRAYAMRRIRRKLTEATALYRTNLMDYKLIILTHHNMDGIQSIKYNGNDFKQ